MSKRNQIRRALLSGRKLSPATASRAPFHCFSLSQRIGEIKRGYWEWDTVWEYEGLKRVKKRRKVHVEGLPVRTKMRKQGGSTYAVYYLDREFLEDYERMTEVSRKLGNLKSDIEAAGGRV